MVPELGQFALILSLFVVLALTILPLLGAQSGNQLLMLTGRSLATGFFVLIVIAFICLVYAFVHDDFSVAYVSSNSCFKILRGGQWLRCIGGQFFAIALVCYR